MNHFLGKDGFVWWIGVVESTDDPLQLGRCRVRCFGYHPRRKNTTVDQEQDVPTDHLPWATCMLPANLNNFYGRPNAGDWVLGFFLDASAAQEPVIMGVLPSNPGVPDEYFSAPPRFVKTFSKVKNDESPNRSQLINTISNVVKTSSKELITLPEEGKFLTKSEVQGVRDTLLTAESRTQGTFAFYHKNGSLFEIDEKVNSKNGSIRKVLLKLSNNSSIEMRKEFLTEAGNYTDYVKLTHNNGSTINIKSDVSSGRLTSNLVVREKGGASITMETSQSGAVTFVINHPKGASITIASTGAITVTSPTTIALNAQTTTCSKLLSVGTDITLPGIGSLKNKLQSMDQQIALAMTLPP